MSRRSERVAAAIRREASILLQEKLKDPRIGFVTVTGAAITEDLRSAVIYYSVLGDDKAAKLAEKGLKSALPFIKKELAWRLKLRYAPDLKLKIDETLKSKERIDELLRKIEDERRSLEE